MTDDTTVRRIVAPEFGGPEVLRLVEEELPPPGPGQVSITVHACGVNPTDFKGIRGTYGRNESKLPLPVGHEVAGVISAIGPDAEIATGGGAVGDAVIAFRVVGGYASAVTTAASNVFARPAGLDESEAANLLLVGTTAADMLRAAQADANSTLLVHRASGAVGVSVLQQARLLGARVIGTASESNFDTVRRFGGEPVAYGQGLESRVRALAPDGVDAALDCVGTDEAVDVSLALVPVKDRVITVAAAGRAKEDGFVALGGADPAGRAFRDAVRVRLVELAGSGDLVVPVARTFPLEQAADALGFLAEGHPGGKLALIP